MKTSYVQFLSVKLILKKFKITYFFGLDCDIINVIEYYVFLAIIYIFYTYNEAFFMILLNEWLFEAYFFKQIFSN